MRCLRSTVYVGLMKRILFMIQAVVQFDLPPDVDRQKALETFERIAPLYQVMEGLIQKYFCFSEEGKGAGIYLWETREAAEKVYNEGPWRERIIELYGVDPNIQFYEMLLTVDNATGEIRTTT
jgi:hypothetical protein